jgi:uncharacterized protein (DUF58 family)
MVSTWRRFWQQKALLWLNKRIPPTQVYQLNKRSIFIFPTGFGWGFLITLFGLFILGTNYQNNLVLLLCQFLAAVMLIHVFISYRNFSMLTPSVQNIRPVYAGEPVAVTIQFQTQGKKNTSEYCQGIVQTSLYHSDDIQSTDANQQHEATLLLSTHERGRFTLPRITIKSDYPLGLIRCWTHLDFAQQFLVYPSPQVNSVPLLDSQPNVQNAQTGKQHQEGMDDFHALQTYRIGDPLHRVAWKRVAKGGDWVIKEFKRETNEHAWLLLSATQANSREEQVSKLTWQVIKLTEQGTSFGLDLNSKRIEPNNGHAHMHECLTALATLAKTDMRYA